jgi:hypothetical protein
VPDDLGRGIKLQRLLLKGNVIELNTAFWFENLTSLVELDISDNQITSLPVTIGMLTQIQVLRVEGTVHCSPAARHPGPMDLLLTAFSGNPLRSPPLELVLRGMRDVLFYLQVGVL